MVDIMYVWYLNNLPVDAFYTLGHVVDRRCDTPVVSFVVHSPFVEQVGPGCEGN